MSPTWSKLSLLLAAALAGCAAQPTAPTTVAAVAAPTGSEALYTPARIIPGRLDYAPDRTSFAPILTERFPYPTQQQANAAWFRLLAVAPVDDYPASVRLFGCTPGALDGETARVTRYPAAIVHCATDFLDSDGRRLGRVTVNFAYRGRVWVMQPVYPPRTPVAWRDRERSPRDFWRWWPGRPRYE